MFDYVRVKLTRNGITIYTAFFRDFLALHTIVSVKFFFFFSLSSSRQSTSQSFIFVKIYRLIEALFTTRKLGIGRYSVDPGSGVCSTSELICQLPY
jgi:hypothetical protein